MDRHVDVVLRRGVDQFPDDRRGVRRDVDRRVRTSESVDEREGVPDLLGVRRVRDAVGSPEAAVTGTGGR